MNYLTFDADDVHDGVVWLEAVALMPLNRHDAVAAKVERVLDWALRLAVSYGLFDDGTDWPHESSSPVAGTGSR